MNKIIHMASILSVLASLTGCEEAAETDGGGEGGSAEEEGGGGAGGAGATDGEQRPAHRAWVRVSPVGYSYAFADIEYPENANTCERTTLGACSLTKCTSGGVEPILTFRSAGKLTLSGGAFPVEVEGEVPNLSGNFIEDFWMGTASITVSMSGAEVPAFGATLSAPDAFELVTPLPKDQAFDRSATMSLSWKKVSGPFAEDLEDGEMIVRVATLVEEPYNIVECSTPVGAGSIDIGADLLLELPAGPAYVTLENTNRQTVAAGDYPVDVRLIDSGVSSTTEWGAASGRIALQ